MLTRTTLPSRCVAGAIRVYQVALSPYFGMACRFHPTCSEYALSAVREYGAVRGGWMAMKRIAKCHPWHAGGIDPVPQRQDNGLKTRNVDG